MTEQHLITPPPELVEQWRTAPEYVSGLKKLMMVTMTEKRFQEIAAQAEDGMSEPFLALRHSLENLKLARDLSHRV